MEALLRQNHAKSFIKMCPPVTMAPTSFCHPAEPFIQFWLCCEKEMQHEEAATALTLTLFMTRESQ